MQSKNLFTTAVFLTLLSSQMGCKSSTSPNNATGASGTLVFGEPIDEVATTSLGSNTSSVSFQGLNPAWTPDGRVIFDLWGQYTQSQHEEIREASINGTNAKILVDLGQYNSPFYANPKMSRNGNYCSFNYYNFNTAQYVGTEIYTTGGTLVATIPDLWDGSWVPDGSIVVAGTVFSLDNGGPLTLSTEGLFKYSGDFTTPPTQIGAGQLTAPWYPSVSPDGSRIAFAMNNHIWTISMDGTGLKQITTGANEETYSCWSPDGSSIACVTTGDIGLTSGSQLAIVSSNPTTPTTVSQDNSSVYVKDNTNSTTGFLNPISNVSWR